MWVKILLLFFVFSFLFKTDHSFDQDLGRHLKLGEIIWQSKSVPQTNLFSYTNSNFPFINTHWLFEVFVYLVSKIAGLQALLLIKIIIFLLSVYLTLKSIPNSNRALLLPVGFIMFHVLRERTEFRPEIFSFLFTALTLFVLNKYSALTQTSSDLPVQSCLSVDRQAGRGTFVVNTRLIFLLPVIQLIWVNTHIYFFVGLILQAIFLIHAIYQYLFIHPKGGHIKLLSFILLLSVIASLINPNGLTGLLYPLNVTQNYGYTIVENQTIFFLENIGFRDPNFLFVKLSIGIICLGIVITFLKRKLEIKNVLLAGFGVTLSLLNIRSIPYLVFLLLPTTLQNLSRIKSGAATKTLAIIFGLILLFESLIYLNGDYYRYKDMDNSVSFKLVENGKKALDFVINNNLTGPIYNNFDIGSYIIYRGYPKYLIFVDGRPEAYPKEFFQDVYIPGQQDPQKFQELDQKIQFKTIIFSHTDQTPWGKTFLTSIVKNNNWKTVYLDDFIIILVKNDFSALQSIELSKLNPSSYSFDSYLSYLRLSLFLLQTQNQDSAGKFAEKGLAIFPQSPLGNALFGVTAQNSIFW
ncbi:hypothetical protein HYU95_04615 [Candidatus Daviesbacteria bacterium]|nr:hypothetical protein [Candidatus Daviesbacteria bacterium]